MRRKAAITDAELNRVLRMVDWTDDAIEAAIHAFSNGGDWQQGLAFIPNWRAALDAAVKAQPKIISYGLYRATYDEGWNDALEEAAAYIEGKGGLIPGANAFSALVSGNPQPCMSGDGRDRMHPRTRRLFDDATADLSAAIRALKDKPANQTEKPEQFSPITKL